MNHSCYCHACRNYFECDDVFRHKGKLRWARHKDGAYYWGKHIARAKGYKVRICYDCMDALQDNDNPATEEELNTKFGIPERKTGDERR